MKLIKNLLIISMVIVCASFGIAKKYSDSSGPGAGQGLSTVGTTGDYTTLFDAAADFNATANTGNWILEIVSNLSEATSVAFGNTILPGNIVTIKPAVGVSPTITFETTGANPSGGPTAHIVIGSPFGSAYNLKKMDGFTIDGSNNGTDSQNLTIQNVPGSSGTLGQYSRMIWVVGDSDNVTVKNCIIRNLSTYYGANIYGVAFLGMSSTVVVGISTTVFPLIPDGWTVQNCNISVGNATFGSAVASSPASLVGIGTTQTGWSIIGNTLYGRRAAIYIRQNGNGTIANNIIRGDMPGGEIGGYGINHELSNDTGWTINIYNNNFDAITTRNSANSNSNPLNISWGVIAMLLQGTGSGTYNIYNNMLGGFYLSGTGAGSDFNYRGISLTSPTATANIFFNSINMPNFSGHALTPDKCYAIGAVSSTAISGMLNIKNNIIRQAQVGGSAIYLAAGNPGSALVSDYNDWYSTDTNPIFCRLGASDITTFTDWKAATGQDANSQNVDPLATAPDHWAYSTTSTGAIIPPTDLHFTGPNPAPLTPGTPITSPIAITTDFDGNARSLTAPWKGCDEVITALVYAPMIIYTRPGEAAIPLTVSGGIAPYNWVVNGGVGTLDMSTGTAVLFTPATTQATGDITITDGAAQTAIIPVSVTPTAAPLFNDTMQTKEVRFEIFE